MQHYLHTLLCMAALASGLCLHAQQPVKITGTVEGVDAGRLLLIVPTSETESDTIARASPSKAR